MLAYRKVIKAKKNFGESTWSQAKKQLIIRKKNKDLTGLKTNLHIRFSSRTHCSEIPGEVKLIMSPRLLTSKKRLVIQI